MNRSGKKIRFLMMAALAAAVVGCAGSSSKPSDVAGIDDAGAEEVLCRPSYLEFYIGGISGDCHRISYRWGRLLYWTSDFGCHDLVEGKYVDVTPTDDRWLRFVREMKSMKASSWKRKYDLSQPFFDGEHWEVVIVGISESADVVSRGDNAYPENFDRLIRALADLTGQKRLLPDAAPVVEPNRGSPSEGPFSTLTNLQAGCWAQSRFPF